MVGLGSYTDVWSHLQLRTSSGWRRIPIDPMVDFNVFQGGRSVLVTDLRSDEHFVYVEGNTDGRPLPRELLGIRARDDRMVFAYCGRALDGACHRVEVQELDAAGARVAAYSADVEPSDWWTLDGRPAVCCFTRAPVSVAATT
jgi:hypothetical protein